MTRTRRFGTLEGLRSQCFPNEEVTVQRCEIMQEIIDGVCNFELRRNLALMYAQEEYVEETYGGDVEIHCAALPANARLRSY